MSYETEDQQVEALKAWWAENGRAVIAGIALGAAGIGGWGWWQSHQANQAVAASDSFSEAMMAMESGDTARVITLADDVVDGQSGTLYAAYIQLAAARAAVANDDLQDAATRLGWVVDKCRSGGDAGGGGRSTGACSGCARQAGRRTRDTLPEDYPESYAGLVEETRGDLLAASGDTDGARAAYQKAQDSGTVVDPAPLTMKLNELAVPASAS